MDAATQSGQNEPKEIKPKRDKKWFLEQAKSFGTAILLVLVIRSSFVEAFKIPSGSMIPTLLVGDHIFVNKFAYGFKLPFSDFFMDEPTYLTKSSMPKRGDIIVFKYPKDTSFYFIKRVIGLPGDKIKVRDKMVYINDKVFERAPLNKPEIIENLEGRQYDKKSMELFEEKILDGPNHMVLFDKNNYVNENFGEITVPGDSVFVMGDNRDFSNDSRFWGFVPFKYVRGRAMVIWLSLWLDFTEGQYYFRPSRVGTVIR